MLFFCYYCYYCFRHVELFSLKGVLLAAFNPGGLRVEEVSYHSKLYLLLINSTQYWVLIYQLYGKFSLWNISTLMRLFESFSRMLVKWESMHKRNWCFESRARNCFGVIAKPLTFGLSRGPKEIFLTYLTQLVFLIIKHVLGNAVVVAIDMCKRSRDGGREWIY